MSAINYSKGILEEWIEFWIIGNVGVKRGGEGGLLDIDVVECLGSERIQD